MSSLQQPFLASVTSEHSLAAPRSHKLPFLLLSALFFFFFPNTTLSLPQHPLHSLLSSPGYVREGRALFSDAACKPACRWKVVGRHVDVCFLRIAYSECELFKRSPMTVLLSPAVLNFPPRLLLNTVPKCLVLQRAWRIHYLCEQWL